MNSGIFTGDYLTSDEESSTYEQVTFLKDFGPWEENEEVYLLVVNHTEGLCIAYDSVNVETDRCAFRMCAV